MSEKKINIQTAFSICSPRTHYWELTDAFKRIPLCTVLKGFDWDFLLSSSHLVVRTVSDLLLGVQESCFGDGGSFPLSVIQQQVGAQLLPLHLASTTYIYLDVGKRCPYVINHN